IETYFYKTEQFKVSIEKVPVSKESSPSGDWEVILTQFENNLVVIDVRHLEMPMPMMTILENLEVLPEEKALYVQHKRIPVFLLSELIERGFDYRIKEIGPGEVYLLVFKDTYS
ncbi:MAG TPA: DUF2249 domain-containing protein, partial [Cyclobacteriaceae bacterium]|nr:DUF2249 domain-containing protein [Cyclobacteriaceae bacterium]